MVTKIKRCNKCEQTMSVELFNKKGKLASGESRYQGYCRECNKICSKEYYANNIEKHRVAVLVRNKRNRKALKQKMIELFRESCCTDCETEDIRVLEFDHLRDKKHNISKMMCSGYSWKSILYEMDKCEIVCANCHRIRTHTRSGTYRIVEE